MVRGRDYIIERYGSERYEEIKAYAREYDKMHREQRNRQRRERDRKKREENYKPIENLEGEEWKYVVEAADYMVSNKGRCKVLDYQHTGLERLMKISLAEGYPRVSITTNGVHKSVKVHRLVAEAFIPIPTELQEKLDKGIVNYLEVNHKDEDKTNNCVENLEWCDTIYNVNYGTAIQRRAEAKKKWVVAYRNENDKFKLMFRSTADAAEMLLGNKRKGTSITAVISGRRKNCKGLKFKYYEI